MQSPDTPEARGENERVGSRALLGATGAYGLLVVFAFAVLGTLPAASELLESVSTGRISHSRFDKHLEKIAIHDDCAIAMGSETVVVGGASSDAGRTIHRRFTDVYVRKGDRWVMVARHANIVPS